MCSTRRLLALACVVLPLSTAQAQSFNSIAGDALHLEARVSSRVASIVIPGSELRQIPGTLQWEWIGSDPMAVTTSDGVVLATVFGRVVYDTGFDNILLDLDVLAGANDVLVRVRTAQLSDSFSSVVESLGVSATLQDVNGNGASVSAVPPDSLLCSLMWNALPVARVLAPYTAPANDMQLRMDYQQIGGLSLTGWKEVEASFTLSAQDRFHAAISAVTSVPSPGGAAPLVIGGFWLLCRRR